MKDNKDVIRQILLDFNKFKGDDVYLCSFEEIVEEFLAIYGGRYLFDTEETK